jgi:hypothetical protein
MRTPGLLIAGAGSWCFVFSLRQFSKSDSPFTFPVFSSRSLLSPTFSLLPGWRTGNALDVVRHSSEQHFIAAFCSAAAVSIVTFLNGASRRPETLFPGPGFPQGGRRPIDAVISVLTVLPRPTEKAVASRTRTPPGMVVRVALVLGILDGVPFGWRMRLPGNFRRWKTLSIG